MKLGFSRIATTGLAACGALLMLPSVSLADHRDRDDRHRRGHGHEREYRAPVHRHGPSCAARHDYRGHDFRRGHRGHEFRHRGHYGHRGHYVGHGHHYKPRHAYRHRRAHRQHGPYLSWWFGW